jgi:hypothetical protein
VGDVPLHLFVYLSESLYWKCCVGRCIVMIQNRLIWLNIRSFLLLQIISKLLGQMFDCLIWLNRFVIDKSFIVKKAYCQAAITSLSPLPLLLFSIECYIYTDSHHPTHFHPKNRNSIYLWNFCGQIFGCAKVYYPNSITIINFMQTLIPSCFESVLTTHFGIEIS